VFGIILGTGVGGGLVEQGRIVGGRGGLGGEWGHGPVVHASRVAPDAMPVFRCGCGRQGCLDTIGSARGIERLHGFLHGDPADSIAITRAAAAGEPRAVATVDYWCDLVGGPLAMLLHATSATIVPVGGGLAHAGGLIAALDARVRANLLAPTTTPIVVPGRLGEDAGLIGAFVAGS
jgi:N-acetylglucosamine kinase